MTAGREFRHIPAGALELRETSTGKLNLVGYASVTERSYPYSFYTETIAAGAFRETLAMPGLDVQLLVNHDGLPLARTRGGTLRLAEDDHGLHVDADLDPGDIDVQRLVPKMRRGLIDQMSFSFSSAKSEWSSDYDERRILSLDLHRGDVSVVNQGASEHTSVAVRKAATAEAAARSRDWYKAKAFVLGVRFK